MRPFRTSIPVEKASQDWGEATRLGEKITAQQW